MTDLETLFEKQYELDQKVRDLESIVRDKKFEFERQVRAEMQPQFNELADATAELKRLIATEQRRVNAIAIESAQSDQRVGGKFCRWDRHWRSGPWIKTKNMAVCEVFTSEHRHMERHGYGGAKEGDLVLRLLKADGTPGKIYESFRGSDAPFGWAPEGEKPKQ